SAINLTTEAVINLVVESSKSFLSSELSASFNLSALSELSVSFKSTSCTQSVLIYFQRASQSSHSTSNSAEQKNQSENQLEEQLQSSAFKQSDNAHVYHNINKLT